MNGIAMCLVIALLAVSAPAGGQERLALVIGNASYARAPLRNPVNDARAVAATLRSLGFAVLEHENVDLRGMIAALQDFSIRARRSGVRVIYYAGHGLQVKGRNYLVPVDAEISTEDEVPRKTADINDVLERLGELREGVNVIILDACRNNPFNGLPVITQDGRRVRPRGATSNQGLASVDAPLGTIVAYATSPGSTALDPSSEKNSVYTKHLVHHMSTPGLTIEQLFKRVRVAVAQETQNLQVPWESSSLVGEFCLRPAAANRCGAM